MDPKIIAAIIIGVATIIGALIGKDYILKIFYFLKDIRLLLPFFFQKSDSNIKLNKWWKTTFEEKNIKYHETVTLVQRGNKIFANFILKQNGEEYNYKFIGTFENLILAGIYVSTDETRYEKGTILLKYSNNGTFLGQNNFFSKTSDRVTSSDYEWTPIVAHITLDDIKKNK